MVTVAHAMAYGAGKPVIGAQPLIRGVREYAHIKAYGKKPKTICGEPIARWKVEARPDAEVCQTCWRIYQWGQKKTQPACQRCGVPFLFWEEKTELCGYCRHVSVSQFGKST